MKSSYLVPSVLASGMLLLSGCVTKSPVLERKANVPEFKREFASQVNESVEDVGGKDAKLEFNNIESQADRLSVDYTISYRSGNSGESPALISIESQRIFTPVNGDWRSDDPQVRSYRVEFLEPTIITAK